MYYLLDDSELKRVKEVEAVTGTDAEITGKFIKVEILVALLSDLLCEYNHIDEKVDDLECELRDNYIRKREDEYEEYGVSRNDFI